MNNKTLLTQDPDCEQAFNEFYGTTNEHCDDSDSELDLLARADEAEAFNERYESVMRQDFPKDYAEDDPFTAALLETFETQTCQGEPIMREFNDDFNHIAEKLYKELNVTTATRDIYDVLAYEDIKEREFEQFALAHLSGINDRLYVYLKPMFEQFEKLGYTVVRDGNTVTLTNYSPAGEELNISLVLDGDEEITLQLYRLSNYFDEEDHAYELLNAKKHGLSGVPSMRELIDDAVAISEMYEQLYETAISAHGLCKD